MSTKRKLSDYQVKDLVNPGVIQSVAFEVLVAGLMLCYVLMVTSNCTAIVISYTKNKSAP